MTFLSPYWLLAASAILIPIAIHLWNKRQGKTVKVGSLRWLEPTASNRWSSIKLTDVWLLLLRCAIFILLAVALAAPFRTGEPAAPQAQKAVYLGEELLHASELQTIKPTVDSLLQRGYSLHRYTSGFEPILQEEWQALSSNPGDSLMQSGNYWQLLPALAQRYPQPQDSVWLFTSDQHRHFTGTRPAAIPANINWIPVAIETPVTWLQTAAQTGADSLLFVLGQSTRESTHYTRHQVAIPAAAQTVTLDNGQQVQLQRENGALWAQLSNNTGNRVQIQTQPLAFVMYADEEQQAEVRYLQASVQAISRYTDIPITLQQAATPPDTAADMLFWLSSGAIPEEILQQVKQQGKRLWVQPQGGTHKTTPASLAVAGTKIRIDQLNPSAPAAGFIRWQTTTGEPLLTEQPEGKGTVYYFRSGFGATWGQLGQSPLLPELLLPVLLPQPAAAYDARAMEEQQLRLPKSAVSNPEKPKSQQYPLMQWFVLAAFVLFIAERLLANRRKNA